MAPARGLSRRECAPIFFCLAKRKRPRPVKRKPLRRKTALMRLICLKYGGPRKRPWWSLSDSVLGAGPVLLNLSVLRHANRNCCVGQRPQGPAALSALPASLSAARAGPGSGSGARGRGFPSTTPILHPRSQMRGSKGRCRHRPLRTAGYGALSRRLSPLVAHLTNDSRPSNFALTDKVGHHKHFFFSTVHGAFSF